ncbi:hypothetical protein IWW50_003202, partial [Coemansia erecta]
MHTHDGSSGSNASGSPRDTVFRVTVAEETQSPSGAAVSAEIASRALRQYLLTEEEAGELSGSDYGAGTVSRLLSDAGDVADNDDSGSDRQSGDEPSLADPLRLQSGYITYDIYKWHRDYERGTHADAGAASMGRRHSRAHSLSAYEHSAMQSDAEWDLPQSHAQITEPGGFRRHYLHQQAEGEGRAANIVTANFVDFLALFGHFAGGDFPSDEDDDTDAESEGGRGADAQRAGDRARTYGSIGEASRARGLRSARESEDGASVRKTFFLLIKSFIGSGVLFLPRAFYNGGLAFSAVLMVGVAGASLYTMLLLVRSYER